LLSTREKFEKALEDIASFRKIISDTGWGQDNEIYVNKAREALDWPLDIPKYDNEDYEE
jgi:hypothetical protein